jgi:hypothetical protein
MGQAQDKGRDFEVRWAKRVGAEKHKGSGNYYLRPLDASNRARYLWSCKHTDKESIRISIDDIDEVIRAVEGPGGIGGETQPAMALSINGREFVLQRASDWLDEHTKDATVEFIKPDKETEKLAKRNTSPLFRE